MLPYFPRPLVRSTWHQMLQGHLLVDFVIIRRLNLAWYLVYLALLYILTCIKDWGAIIGAFVFLPIGSA